MFWKKRDKAKGELDFEVAPDQRQAVRVKPSADAPVFFQIGDQAYPVIDISASGAAFQAPKDAAAGQVLPVRFELPYGIGWIEANLRILDLAAGRARGTFVEMSLPDQEKLHYYALEQQKKEIRSLKKTSQEE